MVEEPLPPPTTAAAGEEEITGLGCALDRFRLVDSINLAYINV